jgi:ABC-2 type transport system permease protein
MRLRLCRCFLLWKRLFRRPGYLVILAAVPLLTLALLAAAGQGSGLVTAALVLTEPEDPAALAVLKDLTENPGAVRVREYPTQAAALGAVTGGEADAAWILGDLTAGLRAYAERGWTDGLIRVAEREDGPLLMLARERLFAALFPALNRAEFDALVKERFGITEEETLRGYYDYGADLSPLVVFEDLSGEAVSPGDYLVSPVRGLLALLVLMAGLASGLYAMEDEERETFLWLSPPERRLLPLLTHLLAELPAAGAALLSLYAAGLGRGLGSECLLLLAYCAACALLSEVLRRLLRREETFAALIPAVLLLSLAASPIFADLRLPLGDLLPTAWYLRAALGL